jgi:hypothetical protein
MGNVSQRVRAIHPYLGIGSLPAVNHQPAFAAATVTAAADRAVRDGAVLLAQTAIDAVLARLFRWLRAQVGCPPPGRGLIVGHPRNRPSMPSRSHRFVPLCHTP